MEKVENAASTLISSIQRQSEQMNQLLAKMQSAEATLDALSNDTHLEFIAVSQTCFSGLSYIYKLMSIDTYFTYNLYYKNCLKFLYNNFQENSPLNT